MAEAHQLFREPGNNSLRTAIGFRRDTFVQRRNLCNSHEIVLGRAVLPRPSGIASTTRTGRGTGRAWFSGGSGERTRTPRSWAQLSSRQQFSGTTADSPSGASCRRGYGDSDTDLRISTTAYEASQLSISDQFHLLLPQDFFA